MGRDVRCGVVEKHVFWFEVCADHKLFFGLEEHTACAVDDWPVSKFSRLALVCSFR